MPAMHGATHEIEASTSVQEPDCLHLWLSVPQAARYFDPAELEATERTRFEQLRSQLRRQEFEVSRALRRQARATDPMPAAESLSHSGGYAALLRAPPGRLVGIDLELHRPRDVLSIARGAFCESEVAVLEALASPDRDPMFYALWTMKEALAKALQLDLLEALRQCQFVQRGQDWHGCAPTSTAGFVAVFRPRHDMSLAVACIGGGHPASIRKWSWPPQLAASWPLIAAISLAAADVPEAASCGSAGVTRAAAPASSSENDGSSCGCGPARRRAIS